MAAPKFVPVDPTHHPRDYESPPRREEPWVLDRPAEREAGHPDRDAGRMGAQGPDQGYVLKLVPLLRDELHLSQREELAAVERGIVTVALKRASLFGRAPLIHDVRVAYTVWGFLDPDAPQELVAERRKRFEGVHHIAPHYAERRALADAVPADVLVQSPDEVLAGYRSDWRAQLSF